jgi:hypothetical protein
MATMTRAQFAKSLQDGLNAHFGLEYNDFPVEHDSYLDKETSSKAFEEDVLLTGFGYASVKTEGGEYAQDSGQEGWTKRYTHRTVGLSFVLTQEAIEDNRYVDLGTKYARALARSLRQTAEVYAANVLNDGFTGATYLGGDGVALFSASHPTVGAGLQSNILSGGADLAESSVEQLLIQIRNAKDDRGIPVMLRPTKLIVPTAVEFDALRLLQSVQQSGTANNDVNAIKAKGFFGSMPVVVTNLTDTDAWFIKTDCMDGLKRFQRVKQTIPKATVEDTTGNIVYRARERYIEGWTNWRGAYGSAGNG